MEIRRVICGLFFIGRAINPVSPRFGQLFQQRCASRFRASMNGGDSWCEPRSGSLQVEGCLVSIPLPVPLLSHLLPLLELCLCEDSRLPICLTVRLGPLHSQ